jgi:hypothetical protein
MLTDNTNTITLQYSSLLDSTVFKTVSRISDQLRELLYFKLDKIDIKISNIFGDAIHSQNSHENIINLYYEILNFSDVEPTIERLNHDIFGSKLIDIPKSEIIYDIIILCYLDSRS